MAKAKAPKVEGLAKSMATLDPVYSEQRALVNEQIEGLGAASEVRRERLEGAKVDAFNQINDQAVGRGVGGAFSGIPLHEQTDFLSREYLPGMQDIEMQEGAERMQLRGVLADLSSQQRSAAISRVDQQTQALNQWNLQQAQIDAQARENKLNRLFQTSERKATQSFTASQNALNRAASAANSGGGVASGPTVAQTQDAFNDYVYGKAPGSKRLVGGDNRMSPADFAASYSQWVRMGGVADPQQFVAMNNRYINPSHRGDYVKALGIK